MNPFKHILVPTDFAAPSEAAVDFAVSLAQRFDAELRLLHVWQIPVYPYMELMMSSAEFTSAVERGAREALETQLHRVQQRLPGAKALLKMGLPWQQVLEVVKSEHIDLVVMGTHGRRGFEHLVMGSVAEKVVRLSSVPVLTVRGNAAT